MKAEPSLLEEVEAFLHHQATARNLSPHTLRAYTGDLVELCAAIEGDGRVPAGEVDLLGLRRHLASLHGHGCYTEIIAYKTRLFVPEALAEALLEAIVATMAGQLAEAA